MDKSPLLVIVIGVVCVLALYNMILPVSRRLMFLALPLMLIAMLLFPNIPLGDSLSQAATATMLILGLGVGVTLGAVLGGAAHSVNRLLHAGH